jgi:polysaccharide biosynthesis transport protein
MTSSSLPSSGSEIILDPIKIAVSIYRGRWVIIAITACFLFLAIAYVYITSPTYKATAEVLLYQQQQQPFEDPRNTLQLGREPQFIESQIAVISSDSVLRPVVDSQNLVDDAEFNSRGQTGETQSEENEVLRSLRKALAVVRKDVTYVIDVTVSSKDSNKAANLANEIAESYLAFSLNNRLSQSQVVAGDVDRQVEILRKKAQDADSKVQAYRSENNLQDFSDSGNSVNRSLTGLIDQLVGAQSDLANAEAAYREIQPFLNGKKFLSSSGDLFRNPRIEQLLAEYAKASQNEAALATRLLPRHPSLTAAQAEKKSLEALIKRELEGLSEAKRVEWQVAQKRVQNLRSEIDQSRLNSSADEKSLIKLRELETEANATSAAYQKVLAKSKESSLAESLATPIGRIISPASAPVKAAWPKKSIILISSILLGFLSGSLLVLAKHVFNEVREVFPPEIEESPYKVRDKALPPSITSLAPRPASTLSSLVRFIRPAKASGTVLGQLPNFCDLRLGPRATLDLKSGFGKALHSLTTYDRDNISEVDYRFLGEATDLVDTLTSRLLETEGNIALLRGPSAPEAISFTAFTLAIACAANGYNVLLVDADDENLYLTNLLTSDERHLGDRQIELEGRDGIVEFDFYSVAENRLKYNRDASEKLISKRFQKLAPQYDFVFVCLGNDRSDRYFSSVTDLADVVLEVNADKRSRLINVMQPASVGGLLS